MELEEIAKNIRKKIFLMSYRAGSGHIAPSFSCVEILVALYFKILNIDKNNLNDENRDRFILSKGHASSALYSILAKKDIIEEKLLDTFCQKDGILGAHPEAHSIPGIEVSTGSLGHGLSFGSGIALAGKIDNKNYKVFVLLSDGECQEGSVWEAAAFASHHKLDNLVAVVDYNMLQSLGRTNEILSLEPFNDRWKAFGWGVKEVDGHNISKIIENLASLPYTNNKPSVLIAHTVKGKGISFMENVPLWHYRIPNNREEIEIALKELGLDRKEFEEALK